MKAMSWFLDCTYLGHSPETKDRIRRECMEQRHIPVIEYDETLGWVFHTLYPPDGTVSRKEIASHFEKPRATAKHEPIALLREQTLEEQIARSLRDQGHAVRRQVRCRAGIADIVTVMRSSK